MVHSMWKKVVAYLRAKLDVTYEFFCSVANGVCERQRDSITLGVGDLRFSPPY